jgi:branched-subunit amino acid transport protein
MWAAVLGGSLACYVLKLAGLSVPQRWLEDDRVQRVATLLPVALLASLIATQTFSTAHSLSIDARAVGLGVAGVAVLLRAPFLVIVAAASITTAALRLL